MAQNGNNQYEAYEAFIQRHRDALWRACWRFAGGDDERCKDLVQEVCIVLWLHFDELREDANKWQQRAWVKKVAYSELVDLHRRGERLPLVTLTNAMYASIPDESVSSTEEDIEELMAALSPEEQKLMRMHIEGYRGDEIAAIMGLKRNAVYQRMYRAMSKVRQVVVVVLLAVVATAMAVVAVPQLREWVFPYFVGGDSSLEEPAKPSKRVTPVADTIPDSTTVNDARFFGHNGSYGKRGAVLSPMPSLLELHDTTRPFITSAFGILCGCNTHSQNVNGTWNGLWECDTNNEETTVLPEVTILVNGNVVVVEDAYNELVSIFDNQGRLVASTQCNGHCSLIVNPDGLNGRGSNSIPYWVQVGSRPRERVFLQFPSLNSSFPIIY